MSSPTKKKKVYFTMWLYKLRKKKFRAERVGRELVVTAQHTKYIAAIYYMKTPERKKKTTVGQIQKST